MTLFRSAYDTRMYGGDLRSLKVGYQNSKVLYLYIRLNLNVIFLVLPFIVFITTRDNREPVAFKFLGNPIPIIRMLSCHFRSVFRDQPISYVVGKNRSHLDELTALIV